MNREEEIVRARGFGKTGSLIHEMERETENMFTSKRERARFEKRVNADNAFVAAMKAGTLKPWSTKSISKCARAAGLTPGELQGAVDRAWVKFRAKRKPDMTFDAFVAAIKEEPKQEGGQK